MMLSGLCGVTTNFGGRDRPMVDVINGWSGYVLDLRSHSLESALRPKIPWNLHDLIGAFYTRDAVQRGLDDFSADGPEIKLAVLEVTDELFRSFTVDDDAWVVGKIEPTDAREDRWWWRRIPMSGPIADEAAGLAQTFRAAPPN